MIEFSYNPALAFQLPPYWLNHSQVVKITNDSNYRQSDLLQMPCACPLAIKWEDESTWWELPIEPLISISGKNNIVRRNVSKALYPESQRGSIKETWSQDDYDIGINGIFINKQTDELPEADLRKLRNYFEARKTLEVRSKLFAIFEISKIVIESCEWPKTNGMSNQMFNIKAYSDDTFSLLIKEDK
jgi:hypothetical protein